MVEIELGKLAELMDAGELVDMKTLVLAQALNVKSLPSATPPEKERM